MLFGGFMQVRQRRGKAQAGVGPFYPGPSAGQQSPRAAVAGNNFVANLKDPGCNLKHAYSFNNS